MVSEQLKEKIPDILDINIPLKDVKNRVIFISIKKDKPYHARIVAEKLFKLTNGVNSISIAVILDEDVNIKDISTVIWKLFNNVDPKRDFYFINGRLSIDATKKLKEEGHPREWPPEIVMDEEIKKRIDKIFPLI